MCHDIIVYQIELDADADAGPTNSRGTIDKAVAFKSNEGEKSEDVDILLDAVRCRARRR